MGAGSAQWPTNPVDYGKYVFIIRKRKNKAGEEVYQVWPSDLPANAPEPPWQLSGDLPVWLKNVIFTA
jgi:hypothetical protein